MRYGSQFKMGLTGLKWSVTFVHLPFSSQFTEILLKFYGAPIMSIYRDFAQILWCPEYINLQRFCLAFMAPRVCQFTEILLRFYGAPSMSIYRDFMVPRVCQVTEIQQRFHGAPSMSIYRDFMMSQVCQFTEILHDQAKHVKSL